MKDSSLRSDAAAHPSPAAIPGPVYAKRDGETARLKTMAINSYLDFDREDTNRVRVACIRFSPKLFRTRTMTLNGEKFLRAWRTA